MYQSKKFLNKAQSVNRDEQMRMVQSGVHNLKICLRCQQLDQIIQQKELYIQELKSQQKQFFQQAPQTPSNEFHQLRKQVYDMEVREMKMKKILDQLQQEVIQKNEKWHEISINNNILSQTNIELRRKVLDLESRILQQDNSHMNFISSVKQMVVSCHPENYFNGEEPTLKQIWKWLKSVLQDYMILKQKSNNSLDYSSPKKQT